MKQVWVIFLVSLMCLVSGCATVNPSTEIVFHKDLSGTWDTVIATDEALSKQTVVNVLSAVPVQGYELWAVTDGRRMAVPTAGYTSHFWEIRVSFQSVAEFNRLARAAARFRGIAPGGEALRLDGARYILEMGPSFGKTVITPEGSWTKGERIAGRVEGHSIVFEEGDPISLQLEKGLSPWVTGGVALVVLLSVLYGGHRWYRKRT